MHRTKLPDLDAAHAAVGTDLGVGEWFEVTQHQIDQFAAATLDDQWIHVDPERAAAGPYGTTIAHGFLTLSLVSYLLPQIVEIGGVSMSINYGVDRVRFPAPMKVGASLRAQATLMSVTDVPGGVQTTIRVTIESSDSTKPVCVADILSRFYE